MTTLFLAIVIAPVPFLFYRHILFVLKGHASFGFNRCAIYT